MGYQWVSCSQAEANILDWPDRDVSKDMPGGLVQQVQLLISPTFPDGKTFVRTYSNTLDTSAIVTGGTRFVTSREVNGFRVVITLPALYYFNAGIAQNLQTTDAYFPLAVHFNVLYREKTDGTNPWKRVPGGIDYAIVGKERNEKTATISIETGLPLAQYEIVVLRNEVDHAGSNEYVDEAYIKEVVEIVDGKLSYPHTALLGLVVRATDQLSGQLPTITSLVNGTKVYVPGLNISYINGKYQYTRLNTGDWDGELFYDAKVWTDNPVWCLYDLLTNTRYGLGNYYRIDPAKKRMMLANFYIMAQYCDEMVTFIKEDGSTETAPRFTLNIVLDQSKSATDWIATIAATFRANCYYSGGIFWLEIDRPKYVSQIFNMSNITDYTQSGTSHKQIPNCFEIQYPDENQHFEINSFRIESPDFQADQSLEERKTTLTLAGVTDIEHAKRLGKYAVVAGQYLTKTITFKTGTDALRCTVSDVIGIQHDVPGWGWGGKILKCEDVSGSTVLTLQDAVPETVITSASYPDSVQVIESEMRVRIGNAAASAEAAFTVHPSDRTKITLSEALTLPWDDLLVPKVGDAYILGLKTAFEETPGGHRIPVVNTFKVTSIARDSDEKCTVSAVQYDEQIYALADDTSDIGHIAVNYSQLDLPARMSVQGVTASIRIYTDSSGNIKTGVTVSYEVPTSDHWKGAVLHWGKNGVSDLKTSWTVDTTGKFLVTDLTSSGVYTFVVTSIYPNGKQTVDDAMADWAKHPWAVLDFSPFIQNDYFLAGVSGLEVVGSLDGTYVGKECRLRWRTPVTADLYLNSTANSVAGGIDTKSWFAYYLVEIRNIDGTLRRSTRVTTESYAYSHEMNHEDGRPARDYDVSVTAYDRLGRNSKTVSLRVSNAPPAAVENIRLQTGVKAFTISFLPSREQDTTGYLIHAVHQNDLTGGDFTPSITNQINNGPETSFYATAETPGTWYVKVAAYDTFEDLDNINYGGLNYNSAATIQVLDSAVILPPELYEELRTDFIVKDVRFYFGDDTPSVATQAVLHWDGTAGGAILRGTDVFALTGTGSFAAANGKYVIARLDKTAIPKIATLSLRDFSSGVPTLVDSTDYAEIVIAITSTSPPSGGINNVCYVRQSNSMEIEAALIRNLTVQADAVVGGTLVLGGANGALIVSEGGKFSVGTDGKLACVEADISGKIVMGPGSTLSWDKIDPATIPAQTQVPSYITSTKITQTTIESPTIAAGTFTGSTFNLGDGTTYGKIETYNFAGKSTGIQIIDGPTPSITVKGGNVEASSIKAGTVNIIDTLQIKGNAVTVSVGMAGGSASIDSSGAPVLINMSCTLYALLGTDGYVIGYIVLKRGGSEVIRYPFWKYGAGGMLDTFAASYKDATPPQGSNTYSYEAVLTLSSTATFEVQQQFIFLTGLKR